jgi:hypothetical protein
MEEEPSSTLTRGAESNPYYGEKQPRLKNIYFQIYILNGLLLSIGTDVPPDQINSELY